MKHYFIVTVLITALISFPNFLRAQQYLGSNPTWVEYTIDIRDQHIIARTSHLIQGDTVIDGTEYRKLVGKSGYYEGGIREDEGKIYANLKIYEPEGLGEILLYDFTAEVGDTIKSNATQGILAYKPVVTKIDTIILRNDKLRKRFTLNLGDFKADTWIEGIGSISWFLYPAYTHATNYTTTHLVCFKQNDTIYYRNDTLCVDDCCNISTNISPVNNKKTICYYPNPTKEKLTIDLLEDQSCESLKIINIRGEIIWKTANTKKKNYEIDMSSFKSGIYILKVYYKSGTSAYKIIKL